MNMEHPLIGMLVRKCVFLNIANICWDPSQSDKYLISQYIFSTSQDDWNGAVLNKLHYVKPVLVDWQSSYRRCRKEKVIFVVPAYLTHSYILKNDPPPQCEHCRCIVTVLHILVDCIHLARTRNDIFGTCGGLFSIPT